MGMSPAGNSVAPTNRKCPNREPSISATASPLRLTACLVLTALLAGAGQAQECDPSSANYDGRKGTTLYVSKLGNNTDGQSWATAFHTIQAALLAIPDDKGGHRIVVRPDRYMEANLAPSCKGAASAYNALIGDHDGKLGSGATGWVLIDSGDPQQGFKSWDWWGTIRASDKHWPHGNNEETFSSIVWDRWILRNLYAAAGDGGLFWDLTDKSGEPFTVRVEDCVGTGRAFGGGVCYPVVRPGEPSTFRRCYFLALDFVGDSAAILVGGWEKEMPQHPHLVLEECTLVHPDNAVQLSYASHCARIKLTRCRLIALNFTQPEMGQKSTGLFATDNHKPTGRLHVDLDDCRLAGCSVFTPGPAAEAVSYTTNGDVTAYVQFKQELPEGIQRVGLWPTELFYHLSPPRSPGSLDPLRAETAPRIGLDDDR